MVMVVHRLPCSVQLVASAAAVVVVGALGPGCLFRRGGLGDGPEENHRFPKNKQTTTASTPQ